MIKINKIKFRIEYSDHLDDEEQGLTDFEKCIIYIKKGMNEGNERITVNHEIVHAYLYANGLYYHESFNQEEVCEIIATHGAEILRFCKKAIKELKKQK